MVMRLWSLGASLVLVLVSRAAAESKQLSYSGCADGTTDDLQDEAHPKIAACEGAWVGHVQNSSRLCAAGWRVCEWSDKQMLSSITWRDATRVAGCFAFNAAQDAGQCRPCVADVKQDDMAGVGRGCPHQSFGQKSCITGGRVDASCCVDSHFGRACQFRPGLATGVLCCKIPGVTPQILVRPRELTHVTSGVTFVLSCVAMGDPTPTVQWFKKGLPIAKNVSRISVFENGYLLISDAHTSDSGRYTCVVSNPVGHDTAVANVLVTDHESGCADGTTDGFAGYEEIQACRGKWIGHVKRARSLCAKGWKVCNPRHSSYLKLLTWEDASQTPGCYAYNAANTLNQCARCHRGDMAGVGSGCGRLRPTHRSCLAEGRVDVHARRGPCSFTPGITTGVMCCKKPKKLPKWVKEVVCSPKCSNGGTCNSQGRCVCQQGWKGAWCQNAVCPGGCIPNSTCIKPGVCRCNPGYTGKKCKRERTQCLSTCLNGGRCRRRKCKCPPTHTGEFCQYAVRWRPLHELNRTEK